MQGGGELLAIPWETLGAGRARASSWPPDVGGQAEEEINWCQSVAGGERQVPKGAREAARVREGAETVGGQRTLRLFLS